MSYGKQSTMPIASLASIAGTRSSYRPTVVIPWLTSWTTTGSLGLSPIRQPAVAVDGTIYTIEGTSRESICKYTNYATTGSYTKTTLVTGLSPQGSISCDDSGLNIISGAGSIKCSTNGGQSFFTPSGSNTYSTYVAVSRDGSKAVSTGLYISNPSGSSSYILYSSNGVSGPFSTFNQSISGTPASSTIRNVAVTNSGVVCIATANGVVISLDFCVSWTLLFSGTSIDRCIVSEAGYLYAFAGTAATQYYSTNGGQSWGSRAFTLGSSQSCDATGQYVLQVSNKKLSTDYGATFSSITTPVLTGVSWRYAYLFSNVAVITDTSAIGYVAKMTR